MGKSLPSRVGGPLYPFAGGFLVELLLSGVMSGLLSMRGCV